MICDRTVCGGATLMYKNIPMPFDNFLTGLKNGDEKTWNVFFNHYDKALKKYCYSKSYKMDVDDLKSILYEKLICDDRRRIKRFKQGSESQFNSYLFKTTRNVIWAESKKIKNFTYLDNVPESYLTYLESDNSKMISQEIWNKALSVLSDKRKAIMNLILKGKKYKEISEILKVSIGSVSSHVARSKPILRDELSKLLKE